MRKKWTNWAGNQSSHPQSWIRPQNIAEIVAAVKDATAQGRRVKVIGSGHSFTAAAVAHDVLIDMTHMTRVLAGPDENGIVECEAGMTLSAVNEYLFHQGRAAVAPPRPQCLLGPRRLTQLGYSGPVEQGHPEVLGPLGPLEQRGESEPAQLRVKTAAQVLGEVAGVP